jgi:hypothetical protein
MAITVVLTVVGSILAALGCIIGFLFYRGYGKIKAKKMDGKSTPRHFFALQRDVPRICTIHNPY